MHHVNVDVRRSPTAVGRPAPSAEAGRSEIESAPEELDRARLSEEGGPETLEDEIGLEQGRGEGPDLVAIVWPDRDVFRKGNRDRDLVRHDRDRRRGELEPSQEVEDVPIKLGDGHGVERHRAAATSAP